MSGRANPLPWPKFEQLGRDLHDFLAPALDTLAQDLQGEDFDKAVRDLRSVGSMLDEPCVATVKLDGTNVGVDATGKITGRNQLVPERQLYQKVNVWSLLKDYPDKVSKVQAALQASGDVPIANIMLYGELVINNKYDYIKSGIHRGWRCFGAAVRPSSTDTDHVRQLCDQLRLAGFNTRCTDGSVQVAPSARFMELLAALGVDSVVGYKPDGALDDEWNEHLGPGGLHHFDSLRALTASAWVRRFLLPPSGADPLGEGLVVASLTTGRLFKFKHAGEDLGCMPKQVAGLLSKIHDLPPAAQELLPDGLVEVLNAVYEISTAEQGGLQANKRQKGGEERNQSCAEQKGDMSEAAAAAYESALTKFNDLETFFAAGQRQKSQVERFLIAQVAEDLVTDYGKAEKEAHAQAAKYVKRAVGIRYAAWTKTKA